MPKKKKESTQYKIHMQKEQDIFDRIEELEKHVRRLNSIIMFHGFNKIDRKYLKAFPKEDECPFFTTEANQFKVDRLGYGLESFKEAELPKDPKELAKAKIRMKENFKKSQRKGSLVTSESKNR